MFTLLQHGVQKYMFPFLFTKKCSFFFKMDVPPLINLLKAKHIVLDSYVYFDNCLEDFAKKFFDFYNCKIAGQPIKGTTKIQSIGNSKLLVTITQNEHVFHFTFKYHDEFEKKLFCKSIVSGIDNIFVTTNKCIFKSII